MKKKLTKLCPGCGEVEIDYSLSRCYKCNTKIVKDNFKSANNVHIFELIMPGKKSYLRDLTELKIIKENNKKYIVLREINDFFIIDNHVKNFCARNKAVRPRLILDLDRGRIIFDFYKIYKKVKY
jgi:hypothetical protein